MKILRFLNLRNYNLINVFGLSVGITCILIVMLWVEDELKYDSFNKNADKIYRVIVEENGMEGYSYSAMTMAPLSGALKEKLPEIEKTASFEMDWPVVVKAGENYFNEEGMAVVGKDFFDIFSFPVLTGNPQLLKTEKYSVVLSEKLAKKYFGEEDAIGKYIEIKNTAVKIIALFKDIDYNSHIRFDFAIPEDFFGIDQEWDNQSLYTYIQVVPDTKFQQLNSKLSVFIPANIDPNNKMKLSLQPLKDIHFQKGLADEDYTILGDKNYVYIFSFMGLFILILACVNFINLSTAVSNKDVRNNGVRRILGALKSYLIKTSILKSILLSSIAALIALGVAQLALPLINTYALKSLEFVFTKPLHILTFISVIFFSGLLSGYYPALYLASFPSTTLTKDVRTGIAQWQRKGLVVFQFSLSIIFIIVTLVNFKQFNHVRQVHLGFDKKNTIYFHLRTEKEKYQILKEKLLKIPAIEMVAGNEYYSPTIINTSQVKWLGNEQGKIFSQNCVDEDYLSLLKVNIIDGRNFSKDLRSEWDKAVIINQKAKELFGNEDPIGKTLNFWGRQFTIIGVIGNTHFQSVQESIRPEFYIHTEVPRYVFVKYNPQYIHSIDNFTSQIQTIVKDVYPDAPIDFSFLDTTYANLYENDKRVSSIFCWVSIIAILISCLGLLGLSSYSSESRTKEIGIRKVNGARVFEVLTMLNKDFIKWVSIAFVIACPIAWYAMHQWLQNFAYKTTISWWVFALAGATALVIALFTVSWQSWRAATRNPVEALRYE